jgi:dGTPase
MTLFSQTVSCLYQHEDQWLAPYAMHSALSTGRTHPELSHPYRGPYQRDRDRIIHSSAFRRLAHKTQVFTGEMGDYHRMRLTHTMEVTSIARTLGRALHLNEDLIESLALLHDVGHPPFGHSGEDVLDRCLQDHGGFNHNRQALRLAELLETRYPDFPGLNLSHEVLNGQKLRALQSEAKQSQISLKRVGISLKRVGVSLEHKETSPKCELDSPEWNLLASKHNLLEMQIVDAADSIAYDTHDADDALEMGLLELEQLLDVPLWREAAKRVGQQYTALSGAPLRRAVVHQLIEILVSDLLTTTQYRLAKASITSVQAIREHPQVLVAPSTEIAAQKGQLEDFLFAHVYRHPILLERRSGTSQALQEMFQNLISKPEQLPADFLALAHKTGVPRAVADYLASMTDRFALAALEKMRAS